MKNIFPSHFHPYPRSFCTGLSLIELLCVLVLVSTLFILNRNAWMSWYQRNQIIAVADQISHAVSVAKIQALLRNDNLVLSQLPGETNWALGMQLFSARTPKIPLQEWHWKSNISVDWLGLQSQTYLRFSPRLRENIINGHFIIKNPSHQIRLVVNRLGHTRII